MKKVHSKFWIKWKGSLAAKLENFTRFSGSITQSQKQLGSRRSSLRVSIQNGFPKKPNLEDEIHSKWGRFVTAWFLPSLICLSFQLIFLKHGVFESFHLDLNTWASLAFTQVFISLPNHHFTSDPPQNNLWNIFLK